MIRFGLPQGIEYVIKRTGVAAAAQARLVLKAASRQFALSSLVDQIQRELSVWLEFRQIAVGLGLVDFAVEAGAPDHFAGQALDGAAGAGHRGTAIVGDQVVVGQLVDLNPCQLR